MSARVAAQRRPGREPRRHACAWRGPTARDGTPLNEGRGVNPGDTGVIPPGPAPNPAALNEGRGVNPGDTRQADAPPAVPSPLNEGRGVNPGDTPRRDADVPASPASLNEGRGVNPGDTGTLPSVPTEGTPLNEGRGVNPGDTITVSLAARRRCIAQRRPGREPRRHQPAQLIGGADRARSTKAGA